MVGRKARERKMGVGRRLLHCLLTHEVQLREIHLIVLGSNEYGAQLYQEMLTARRTRDGRLVTIDGTPTAGAGNLAGYANYACDGAANARLSDEAGAPPPGHAAPTYVVIRAEAAVLAGTEIRIDYNLAQRYAAMRSAGRGKRLCTERTRVPRLPYQEQLLRQGATMDQLNDVTVQGREVARTACAGGCVRWKRCGGSGADATRAGRGGGGTRGNDASAT